MYDILAVFVSAALTISYRYNDWAVGRTWFWACSLLILGVSNRLAVIPGKTSTVGVLLFTVYGLCGLWMMRLVECYIWFFILHLLYLVGTFVQYYPPIRVESKGAGGVLTFVNHGFLMPFLHGIVLLDYLSMRVFLFTLASHAVYQAWRILYEYQSYSVDLKKGKLTTAVLLGKHDCFRMFVVFNVLSWAYVVVDALSEGYASGLPLVLIVWCVVEITRFKNSELGTIYIEYFAYYLAFSAMSIVGNIMGDSLF